MEFDFDLGKALKTLKAQEGIINSDIARIAGKSITTVSQWVNGNQSPSLDTLCNICWECDIQLSTFVKWGEQW